MTNLILNMEPNLYARDGQTEAICERTCSI